MKNNWQTKKLGELCQIEIGKTPYRGNNKFWDGEKQTQNVWLSIADLLNTEGNIVNDSKEYISNQGAKISKLVKKGTLLASFKLTLGRLAFTGKDLYTNEAIAALEIKNEKELSKDYLYHYLKIFDWNAATQGDIKIKGKTLNKSKLKEILISFPESLNEQKRILKILDEVLEKIEEAKKNTEKNLQNSHELLEAYLQGIFENPENNWEEKILEEVCEIFSKLIDPRKKDFLELLHIGAGNIETKTGQLIDLKTSKEEKLISGKFLFDSRMILYSKIRPYLMKVVRPEFNGLCSADIYPLLPNLKLLDRDFLFYLLLSPKFTDFAIKGSARAGMPKINREHLFAYKFYLPTLPEQKSIVVKLDALSAETKKLEAIYKQKLADLEELKKSILSKAFTGEL